MLIISTSTGGFIRRLIFIFVLVMSSGFAFSQESVANVVKRSSDAVVLIVTSDSNGQETALGSGFVISGDCKIVTNFHVIKGADSAVVKLSSGAFFPVSGVLASDPDRDLAIIKVGGKNLHLLTLGDDDQLSVGDHVIAIGSPLGLEGTVSDGIVSALRVEAQDKRWIQTTAPVSHGNSGGPLFNMQGKVVGVITWGVKSEEGQNLNFAVPSDEVRRLLSMPLKLAPIGSIESSVAKPGEPSPAVSAGQGDIPQDRWQAAVAGDSSSQCEIGMAYRFGLLGIHKDAGQARYWFAKAATQGDGAAQQYLGEAFEYGEGGLQDDGRAAYWYRRAVEQNMPLAQVALGMMYQEGRGVPQDYGEGAKWLREAAGQGDINSDRENAEQGYVSALYSLGLRYYIGEGVPQDYRESFFWLELVTTAPEDIKHRLGISGIPAFPSTARLKKMAASHLNQAELEQMEDRARKWIQEHPHRYE